MICPINPDVDLPAFRTLVYSNLISLKDDLDVKAYMKDMYNKVLEATEDQALALDYARLIPTTIDKIRAMDSNISKKLRKENNLDVNELADLVEEMDEANQADLTRLNKELIGTEDNKLEEADQGPQLPPGTQTQLNFDEKQLDEAQKNEPTSVFNRMPLIQTIIDRARSLLRARTYEKFNPLTAFATRNLENSSGDSKAAQRYNKFVANVQRELLSQLENQLRSNEPGANLSIRDKDTDLVADVVLTLVPSKDIIENRDGLYDNVLPADYREEFVSAENKEPGGAMLVVTDLEGNPINFLGDGSPTFSTKGQPAMMTINATKGLRGNYTEQDKAAINAIAKELKTSTTKAQKIFSQQLELISDARQYIKDNPGKTVKFQINGGSLGFLYLDLSGINTRTPLSSLKESMGTLNIVDQTADVGEQSGILLDRDSGILYFSTEGMYGQPVFVERPTIEEAGLGDMLTSLIVDELVDISGNPVSPQERNALLDQYIYQNKNGISLGVNNEDTSKSILYIRGKLYNLDTQEQRDAVRPLVREFLTARKKPVRYVSEKQVKERVKNGKKIVTNEDYKDPNKSNFGDIWQDPQTKKYYSIESLKLHSWKPGVRGSIMQEVKIDNSTAGTTPVLSTTQRNYKDFVKDNFYIGHQLTKEGKLKKQNPYLTFNITDESERELYAEEYKKRETIKEETSKQAEEVQKKHKETPTSDEKFVQDLLNKKDEYGFKKRLDQKNRNAKATIKQIQEAKAWYENSPISDKVPFEAMFDLVNSDENSIARWTLAGITLYKGSDFTDLYHEAWHAFSQVFMTPVQRQELYNVTRKKKGTFTDHFGKTVSFRNASDLQIEEYLAERFRGYMLNPSTKKVTAKEKSLFRKILDVLKAIFTYKSPVDTALDAKSDVFIEEIFEKLRVGNITEYSFNVENATFAALDKGGVRAMEGYDGVQQLNYENTMKLVNTMDSLISEFIDMNNSQLTVKEQNRLAEIDELLSGKITDVKQVRALQEEKASIQLDVNGNPKGTYAYTALITKNKKFLENAYRYANFRLSTIKKEKLIEYNAETNVVQKEILKKQIDLLEWAEKNFGDLSNVNSKKNQPGINGSGLIAKHIEKSATFMDSTLIKTLDFEGMNEDEAFMGKQWDKAGNEQSMQELAKSEVVYLLKQVYKRDNKGNVVKNDLGINEPEEFSKMWNRLARTLQNVSSIEEMYIKLQEAATDFTQFSDLLNKLGPLQTDNLQSLSLWSNFYQTFGMSRVPLIQVTVDRVTDKDGNVSYNQSIGEAFNADYAVGRSWQAEFDAGMPTAKNFIKKDNKGSYLDIDAIARKWNSGNINENPWQFFNDIGFTLSDNQEIRDILKDNVGTYAPLLYLNALKKLQSSKNPKLRNYKQITTDLSGRYKALQILEAKYSDVFSNFMVTNAEGNTQFEHTLNNTMTMMVNGINNATDYNTLIAQPEFAHLDVTKNPFAESSMWMKSMFDLTGSKNPADENFNPSFGKRRQYLGQDIQLEVVNLSGVLLQENGEKLQEGVATAKADEFTKLIMDIHLGYNNYPELTRHADKGTSFGVRLTGPLLNSSNLSDSYVPAYMFGNNDQTFAMKQAFDAVLPHMVAEMKRMRIARKALKDKVKDTDFKYLERGKNFVTFTDIIKDKQLKDDLIKIIESEQDIVEALNENTALRGRLQAATTKYFTDQIEEVNGLFSEVNEFMSDNIISDIIRKGNNAKIRMNNETAKKAVVAAVTINTFLHHLDSISLLYGDLAQYKHEKEEFHKRNAGIGSTGRVYRTDFAMQEYLSNNLENTYAGKNQERLGLTTLRNYTNELNTTVVSDHEIGSVYQELQQIGKAYQQGGMNEADAQGLITFDAYRRLKIAEGNWSDVQQDLYERIINNERPDPSEVIKTFPVIKAQYWGPLKTDLNKIGLPVTAFHKYSLFPMIPTVIADKNMGLLHDRMVQEGIDYLTFQSGSKIGTVTESKSGTKSIYKEGTRELAFDNEFDPAKPFFTKNVIFLKYLKNQLEINDEPKGAVIFSTQFRKLVEDGLMENGVPIDFRPKLKDSIKRIRAWNKVENKEEASPYYKLIKDYEGTISKLVDIAKEDLLREMQWTQDPKTGKLSGDKKNLVDFIHRELSRKELADHELEFLNKGVDLSLSLNAQDIEKMMNALIVKKLVKQKVNGEALVQVANTLMETIGSTQDRNYRNATAEEIEKYGTNDLPFYTKNKDGSTNAMKVKVALQGDFINLLELEDLDGNVIGDIDTLNRMIKEEEWLNKDNNRKMITMTGVRIPVQGLNSMEFMEVYEFLPAEAGGIIVAPSEIVAKSGADFDVDKMTVMMPNITRRVKRANLTNNFLRGLSRQNPELDFSRDNVNIILDAVKDGERTYRLTEEDKQIADIIADNASTEIIYDTGDTRKGLQNTLITNLIDILQLPVNRKALTTPNSTELFTEEGGLSEQLKLNKKPFSATDILTIPYNLRKHAENAVGKSTLGLGAVDNTYNTLFNRIGAYMNPTTGVTDQEYSDILSTLPSERTDEQKNALKQYKRQKLFLPHNTIETKDGTAISLSSLTSKGTDQSISDIINQMINGWVDIAKDTWIFNIQGNKEVAPTLLFMVQAGVPVDTAVYFAANPIVRAYVKEQKKSKSTFAKALGPNKAPSNPSYFRSQALANILKDSTFGFDFSSDQLKGINIIGTVKQAAFEQVNEQFDLKELEKSAKDGMKEDYIITENDRKAFLHFIELENMGKAVRDIKMKMNVDTSVDQSLYEAQSRIKMKDGLRADNRFPTFIIDNLISDSPIGSFFVQPFQVELLGRLFPLRNHPVINDFIDNININDVARSAWPNKEAFAADFKNEFISFILQNEMNSFDINNLEEYKGLPVDEITDVTSLKYGAAVKDGKLFISKQDLKDQYKMLKTGQPTHLKDIYAEQKLAPIVSAMFDTESQYYQFVVEREVLRSKLNMNELQYDIDFKNFLKMTTERGIKDPASRVKTATEVYLRNKAFEKTFNNYHTFKGLYSYATRFIQLKELYPQLSAEFSIMSALEYSENLATGRKNLKLNSNKLTSDEKNVLYENLVNLTDSKYLEETFPNMTEADIAYITNYFTQFPMVAYLQSGLNTRTTYSLTSIVPVEDFMNVMGPAYTRAINALESKDSKLLEQYLLKFAANSKQRALTGRGKNYSIEAILADDGLQDTSLADIFTRLLFGIGTEQEGKYTEADDTYSSVVSTDREIIIMKDNTDNTYVFNGAIMNEGGTGSSIQNIADKKINDAGLANTIGLRTNMRYQVNPKAGGIQNDKIKDLVENGVNSIDPEIQSRIDADIEEMIQAEKDGQTLKFAQEGYGQNLLSKDRNGKMFAPQTFLYLSKQLFENFNYLNPGYLELNVSGIQPGLLAVQSAQQISDVEIKELNDEAVRDLMKKCKL